MRSHDVFRRKLGHRLLQIAEDRRRACADQPTGEDLKVIARCEILAASASDLDPRLCADVDDARADPAGARRFAALWAALPEALATTLWPRSASELVAWMIRQPTPEIASSRRARLAAEGARARGDGAPPPDQVASVMGDLTGGLAAVAPIVAVWEVSAGLRQWHDAGIVAHHAETQARVIAMASPGDRGTVPGSPAMIAFVPARGRPECHVAVDLGSNVPIGSSVGVVPLGTVCTAPLVPATIGDPATSFGLAAIFAVAGLLSLKAWCWLRVRAERTPDPRPGQPMRLAS